MSGRFNSRARVGATRLEPPRRAPLGGFNSRARVGATTEQAKTQSSARFQFTRPGGRDLCVVNTLLTKMRSFNSRARVGATLRTQRGHLRIKRFNSRARVGATLGANTFSAKNMFQFTRPGGRDRPERSMGCSTICFNSRARVGATGGRFGAEDGADGVSIHAPGWARRKLRFRQLRPSRVSIHAPGWARLHR